MNVHRYIGFEVRKFVASALVVYMVGDEMNLEDDPLISAFEMSLHQLNIARFQVTAVSSVLVAAKI
jgi:pyruvoyl-dependent arginine decarboxylase (PvlArgDC)